jgi:hypothetical protein
VALLDTTPKLVRDVSYRTNLFSWATGALQRYKNTGERIYEWACDDTGGETTHEGTLEGGGYYLEEYGREISHDAPGGIWREIYRTRGEWTDVP